MNRRANLLFNLALSEGLLKSADLAQTQADARGRTPAPASTAFKAPPAQAPAAPQATAQAAPAPAVAPQLPKPSMPTSVPRVPAMPAQPQVQAPKPAAQFAPSTKSFVPQPPPGRQSPHAAPMPNPQGAD